MKPKQYCPELTVMSGLAIVYVLIIHTVGSAHGVFFPNVASYADCDFLLCLLGNIASPSVPMFLFVSGCKYYMNDRDTGCLQYWRKRLPKVMMSFFIINTLFWALDSVVWMECFDAILLLKTYISSCLGNTIAYPLWYIPMYCCVILCCPVMCLLIRTSWVRFLLYLIVGVMHRGLASTMFPILDQVPFRFIYYPIFFELGICVCQYKLADKIKHKHNLILLYLFVIILVSWLAPDFSDIVWMQFLLYYIVGTFVYYLLSQLLCKNKVLFWLGTVSYPVFLLHEPVIGRFTGNQLRRIGISSTGAYSLLWFSIVLVASVCLMHLLKRCGADRYLWNYRLRSLESTSTDSGKNCNN